MLEIFTYKNKYGSVMLEVMGEYQHVSKFHAEDVPENCFISMDEAEQIALITDNLKIQECFSKDLKKIYIIRHKNANTAVLCKPYNLNYMYGKNCTEAIKQARSYAVDMKIIKKVLDKN